MNLSAALPPLAHIDFPMADLRRALGGQGAMPDLSQASEDPRPWIEVGHLLERAPHATARLAPHLSAFQAVQLLDHLANSRTLAPHPWKAWLDPLLAQVPRRGSDDVYALGSAILGLLHKQAPNRYVHALAQRARWEAKPADVHDLLMEAMDQGIFPQFQPSVAKAMTQAHQSLDKSLLEEALKERHKTARATWPDAVHRWLIAITPAPVGEHLLMMAVMTDQPEQVAFLQAHGAPWGVNIPAYLASDHAQIRGYTAATVDRVISLDLYNDHWPEPLRPWLTEACWPHRQQLPNFLSVESAHRRQAELAHRPPSASVRPRRRA